MNIKIISIGNKISEKDLNNYCIELVKRINAYAKIEEVNLKNTKNLYEIIDKYKNIFVLDVDGKQITSF